MQPSSFFHRRCSEVDSLDPATNFQMNTRPCFHRVNFARLFSYPTEPTPATFAYESSTANRFDKRPAPTVVLRPSERVILPKSAPRDWLLPERPFEAQPFG